MAKATTSPLITAIAQRIGRIVFQQFQSSTVVRTQPGKTKTAQRAAQTFQANYNALIDAWRNVLAQTDRDDWTAEAILNPVQDVFGNDATLNGWAFFIKQNLTLLSAGNTYNVSPPTPFTVTTPTQFTASASSSAQTIQIDSVSPVLAATEKIIVGVRPFIRPSWSRIPARLPTVATSQANPGFPFNFETAYIAKHGKLYLGLCIGITLHVLNTDNGSISVNLHTAITVAA